MTLTLTSLGGAGTVTGSRHLLEHDGQRLLIDCGLFQGEKTGKGASASNIDIDFSISHIRALLVTHIHIDNVGRIP